MPRTSAQPLALAAEDQEIPDDETPTAFYRRPRRAPSRGRLEAHTEASTRPSPPTDDGRRRRRRAKTEPTPPLPTPTLLLPTSEARELTSDGTILSPMAEPTQLPSPRRRRARRELRSAGRQLGAAWARLAGSAGALRRSGVGLGLLSSAITLACGGVVVVAYVYLTSAEPLASSPSAQPTTGPILRAVDLGGRLRGQQSTLEASR